MFILVLITIGVLWWAGAKTKEKRSEQLDRYYQELLTKEENLETAVTNATSITGEQEGELPISNNWQTIEIKTSSTTSTTTLKQYGLALGEALGTFGQKRESEVKATYQALDQKSPVELKKVVGSRLIHEETINKLRLVVVPQGLADYHRQLINSLQNSVQFLSQMEQVLDNPETALEASKLFVQESILFHQIMSKINNYLISRQVQFPDNEKIKALFQF
ncbi:MAG: hypothetical protein WC531_02680 [Candidatus Paceibacterota bacterium]